jgi:hypothetical protein
MYYYSKFFNIFTEELAINQQLGELFTSKNFHVFLALNIQAQKLKLDLYESLCAVTPFAKPFTPSLLLLLDDEHCKRMQLSISTSAGARTTRRTE